MQYQVIKTYEYKQVVSVEADSEEEAIDYSMYVPLSYDNIEESLIWIEVQRETDIWQMDTNEYNS